MGEMWAVFNFKSAFIVTEVCSRIHLRSYAAFAQPSTSVGGGQLRNIWRIRVDWSLWLLQWIFTVGLTLSALVDIMITASLCYFLRKNRTMIVRLSFGLDHAARLHPYGGTVHLIDTLTLWTIQNGSITWYASMKTMNHMLICLLYSAAAIASLACVSASPIVLLTFDCLKPTVDRYAWKSHFSGSPLRYCKT